MTGNEMLDRESRKITRKGLFLVVLIRFFFDYGMVYGLEPADKEEDLPLSISANWDPEKPCQGDVVHISAVLPEGAKIIKGKIGSKSLHFFPLPGSSILWHALFGIDADHAPGKEVLKVWIEGPSEDMEMERTFILSILARKFDEEHLTLPDSMVHLNEETLKRVRKDQAAISSLWSQETPVRYWDGSFLPPVEGRPGSPFGLRRWINGEPRNFHTGIDIKEAEGTPVRAANNGRFALVGDFFFSGQSVFIDHGQGLFTMYFHLSEIRAKQGEQVRRGEILGWVGKTGRATGPHLHWGVRLGRSRVDPEALIRCTETFSTNEKNP